ncbi:MAG TPA: LamG domain-containing protein [Ilumatobacteraceae bacterium]|nr:LamG domain-containing protein [Ilumatobacteraceae bacterium]
MNGSRICRWALTVAVVALAGACGSDDDTTPANAVDTTTTAVVSTSAASSDSPGAIAVDDADFGWALDGDGSARSGGIDVELAGAFEASSGAVSFDGYTGHAVTSGPVPLDTTQSFTLSAWVNYAKRSAFIAAVGLLGDDSYAAALAIGDEGQWLFATKTQDVTGVEHAVVVEGGAASPGDSWTHLAGVYDAEAGTTAFYVNAELAGEASTGPLFAASGPLTIGRGQFDGGPGNYWSGAIGDVAVFQKALTADEITTLQETTEQPEPAPPMPAPDPSTYANGILNGTWDYVYDDEDAQIILADFAEFVDDADEVIVRIGFDDHEYWIGFLFDGVMPMYGGVPEGAGGTITIEDDLLITDEGFGSGVHSFVLADDSLTLTFLEGCDWEAPEPQCSDVGDPLGLLVSEHTFTKSSDDPRRYER